MKTIFPHNPFIISKTFDVGQDWEVPISGFFIIGALDKSKRSFKDFTDEELGELVLLIKNVRIAMEEVLEIKEVYVFENEDSQHGFHVLLFPRHDWMKEFGRKIESVRPIMNHAVEHRNTLDYIQEVNESTEKVRQYFN